MHNNMMNHTHRRVRHLAWDSSAVKRIISTALIGIGVLIHATPAFAQHDSHTRTSSVTTGTETASLTDTASDDLPSDGLPIWAYPDVTAQVLLGNADIQAASLNIKIKEVQSRLGNFNIYPTLSTAYTHLSSETDGENVPQTGTANRFSDSRASQNQWSVSATYSLFNGFGDILRYQKAGLEETRAELEAAQILNSTLISMTSLYARILTLQTQLELAIEVRDITQKRLTRLEKKVQLGSDTPLDLLGTQVDYQTAAIDVLQLTAQLDSARRDLTHMMGLPVTTLFTLDPPAEFVPLAPLDDLSELALVHNPAVRLSRLSHTLLETDRSIVLSAIWPKVNVTATYSDSANSSNSGFYSRQDSTGFSASIRADLQLFNGFSLKRSLEQNRLFETQSQIRQADVQRLILNSLKEAYAAYHVQLKTIELSQLASTAARQRYMRTLQLYELGQVHLLDVQAAKQEWVTSRIRTAQAEGAALLLEVTIRTLVGQ